MTTVGIIGSSVSGVIAAHQLSKNGFDVLLFDKKDFPRDKPCGGGLTGKTIKLLESIDIKLPGSNQLPFAETIDDFLIINPTTVKGPFDVVRSHNSLASRTVLKLVNRYDFDNWLRSQLDFKRVAPVNDIILGWKEDTSHKMALLGQKNSYIVDYFIAADGVNSTFGKEAHGPFTNDETIVACESILPNPRRTPYAAVVQNPTADPLNAGYSWVFAKEKTANVGTGVMRSYDKYYGFYKDWMKQIAVNYYGFEPFGGYNRNWTIPLFKSERNLHVKATTYKGIVIGDALGVADVFFAEGIFGGMLSAVEASSWLCERESFYGFHRHWYDHPYAKTMEALRFLQWQANGNYNKSFNLLSQPKVIDGFINFICGDWTPQQFLKWVSRHYFFKSTGLYLTALLNKGKEKERLKYVGS